MHKQKNWVTTNVFWGILSNQMVTQIFFFQECCNMWGGEALMGTISKVQSNIYSFHFTDWVTTSATRIPIIWFDHCILCYIIPISNAVHCFKKAIVKLEKKILNTISYFMVYNKNKNMENSICQFLWLEPHFGIVIIYEFSFKTFINILNSHSIFPTYLGFLIHVGGFFLIGHVSNFFLQCFKSDFDFLDTFFSNFLIKIFNIYLHGHH